MRLSDLQRAMHEGLLRDPAPILALIAGPHADERLAVHRRHVAASLTGALRARFPAIEKLVGEEFFAFAADTFLRAQPPRSPCLGDYGGDFPAFLAAFEPARDPAYLADVARLEWALHESSRAAIATGMAPAALAAIDPEEIAAASFTLDPARRYLRLDWPADRILAFARDGGDTIEVASEPVCLEVFRRGAQVGHRRLAAPGFALRSALADGATLGEAIARAGESCDVNEAFGGLLVEGAIIRHHPNKTGT